MLPPNPEFTLRLIEADAELRRAHAARIRLAQARADEPEAVREHPIGRRMPVQRVFLRLMAAALDL